MQHQGNGFESCMNWYDLDLECKASFFRWTHLHHVNMCLQPKQIQVSSKTGIPLDVLPKRGLTGKQVERMERINDSDLPRVSTQPRSQDESTEERRARKQAIKTERKVRTASRRQCLV